MSAKRYLKHSRFKRHVANAHEVSRDDYALNGEDLKRLLGDTIRKIVENPCYPEALQKEISTPLESKWNGEEIVKFFSKSIKVLKKGKLEKLYADYYAQIVLKYETIFSKFSNNASTLVLSKLIEMVVADYKKFLTDASESANTQEHQLAENEIYSLQYIAGYVIHKLHKRIDKKTHQEVISVLLACKGDENVMQNSKMFAAQNRGGLWCITPELRSILEIVEIKFRNFMVTNRKMVNIDRFVTDNM